MEGILIWLIVGGIAGWLAGMIMKGSGQGLLMNIIIGIVGAVIGGWVFNALGVLSSSGLLGSIITATIGAIILLALLRLLKK